MRRLFTKAGGIGMNKSKLADKVIDREKKKIKKKAK